MGVDFVVGDDAQHLFQGGGAGARLVETVLLQGDEPGTLAGDRPDRRVGTLAEDRVPDRIVDDQDLGNGGAPLVADVVALDAPDRGVELVGRGVDGVYAVEGHEQLVRGVVTHLADGAEDPQEPLRDDRHDGRGDEEGFDPDLEDPEQCADGVLRVEGGDDLVAGERHLDDRLGGKLVPDLPDHDDVRVMPKQGFKEVLEVHPGLLVDLSLDDAVDFVFDRILDGQDLLVRGVQVAERRIHGGRFPRSGRADDHRDPGRDVEELLEDPQGDRGGGDHRKVA